jgi:YfiH family protein
MKGPINPQWITPDWPTPGSIFALTTCRDGGISAHPWPGLNLGDHVGDDPKNVANSRLALQHHAQLPAEPIWLNQQHSDRVVTAGDASHGQATTPPAADACYSDQPGQVCAILSADCLPILVCNNHQIAAIHAGWRGLATGIIGRTLARFAISSNPPIAWIGPAICPRHYPVDSHLRNRFLAIDRQYQGCFTATTALNTEPQWQMDLHTIATLQLRGAGVGQVFHSEICNYQD